MPKPAHGEHRSPSTEQLYKRVARTLEEARCQVARAVNTAMVHTYWHVGREIVEVEQAGRQRAGYGDEVIEQLSVGEAGGSIRPRLQRSAHIHDGS